MRHCIAVRSWASSTSTCPNVRGSSDDDSLPLVDVLAWRPASVAASVKPSRPSSSMTRDAGSSSSSRARRLRLVRRGRAASTGPSWASASSIERDVVLGPRRPSRCRGRARRCSAACSASVSTSCAAERTSAAKPKRSFTSSAPERIGHMRSRASFTSGRPRSRARISCSQPSGSASPRTSAPATLASSVASRSNRLVTFGVALAARRGAGTSGSPRSCSGRSSMSRKRCATCGRCSLCVPRRRCTPSTSAHGVVAAHAELQPVDEQREVVAAAGVRGRRPRAR